MYRIYFNSHSDYPKVWSFDKGSTSSEVKVEKIIIDGDVFMTSAYSPAQDNVVAPRAWMQIGAGVRVLVRDGVARFIRCVDSSGREF